jgi:hypothetical protein|tara:strand:- start:297 stop:413 length:117 start_codon:yes stop_codon:yes gene_type:complete
MKFYMRLETGIWGKGFDFIDHPIKTVSNIVLHGFCSEK